MYDSSNCTPVDLAKQEYTNIQQQIQFQQRQQQDNNFGSTTSTSSSPPVPAAAVVVYSTAQWDIVTGNIQSNWQTCIHLLNYYSELKFLWIIEYSQYCLPIQSKPTSTSSSSCCCTDNKNNTTTTTTSSSSFISNQTNSRPSHRRYSYRYNSKTSRTCYHTSYQRRHRFNTMLQQVFNINSEQTFVLSSTSISSTSTIAVLTPVVVVASSLSSSPLQNYCTTSPYCPCPIPGTIGASALLRSNPTNATIKSSSSSSLLPMLMLGQQNGIGGDTTTLVPVEGSSVSVQEWEESIQTTLHQSIQSILNWTINDIKSTIDCSTSSTSSDTSINIDTTTCTNDIDYSNTTTNDTSISITNSLTNMDSVKNRSIALDGFYNDVYEEDEWTTTTTRRYTSTATTDFHYYYYYY